MPEPVFPVRCFYAPGHFGNSYEVMGADEMREMLSEARHWGFTHYADWFDTVDCSDPFADTSHHNMGHELWGRKKANFRAAYDMGLACGLTMTPNHVFLDQCQPDTLAVKGDRIFGQLICPSKPRAREIILRNYQKLLGDLAKAGVRLSMICPGPYDYGGCACEDCAPWIITCAELWRDLLAIAEKHHPGVEMHPIGWWWSAEEHQLFAEWADREMPGQVKSIFLHIPYGNTDVSDVPLPQGCHRRAFVHIGYADQAAPKDVYGHLGPVIAPERLPKTIESLKAHGCTGFMAYSEGVYEDVNKALLAGISSGRYATADEVLSAYAQRYFSPDAGREWGEWLKAWSRPYDADASALADQFVGLSAATTPSWRLRQWELKAELLKIHAEIGTEGEWTPERLAAVDRFWSTQEVLQRQVYGLGPIQHILARRFTPLPWYASWAAYQREHATSRDQE